VISAEVGRRLRLPVPPSCTVQDAEGKPFFASLNFLLTGDSLPPIVPDQFFQTFGEQCCDIVVFDAYIANPDRHPANLSADYADQPRFNLFDHSHALLGPGRDVAAKLLALENDIGLGGHCLKGVLRDDRPFEKMLSRVEHLEDYFIRDVVSDIQEYGLNDDEVTLLTTFLLNRRQKVRELIAGNKHQFPAIAQWSLL